MMAENNIHPPIPTSFFHATATVALIPQPQVKVIYALVPGACKDYD